MQVQPSFAQWLRERRKALDLTQAALAERVGCATITLRRIENGERRPSMQIARNIAEELSIPPEEIDAFLRLARAEGELLPVPEMEPHPPPVPAPDPREWAAGVAFAPLPVPPTPLVGRERAVAVVREMFESPGTRLVTLLGPPGIGKTRLALAVAAGMGERFSDGVAFAALAAVRDASRIPDTIARALGLKDAGQPDEHALARAIAARHLLLVLDNFEQVIAAAPIVADLLARCPHLAVLVTSRAPLRLSGEHEYLVPPLALPDRRPIAPAHLAAYEAVRFFVARARAVNGSFSPRDDDYATIAEICRQLDGLPLAIELAAARTRTFALGALRDRLRNRLTMLTGGARDLPARQQTLRDAIAWSYDLLAPGEGAVFAQLSAFASGATLDAAEAVCGAGNEGDLLDGIASLLDQSLVYRSDDGGDVPRLCMLESVREYAAERLVASGARDGVAERHARFYLALAEQAAPEIEGPMQGAWVARLEREHDNMRAAIAWMRGAVRYDLTVRLGWALQIFWAMRGYHREGRQWIEEAIASGSLAPAEEAIALGATGLLARMHGDYAASAERLDDALVRFRDLGDTPGILVTLSRLGHTVRLQGDLDRAQQLAEEGLALARATDDWARIVWMLDVLGLVAMTREAYTEAAAMYEEALPLAVATGDRRYIAAAHTNLGLAALGQGQVAMAAPQARAALALNATLSLRRGIGVNLDTLASVAAITEAHERAARLFAAAEAVRDHEGLAPWTAADRALFGRYLPAVRSALGEDQFLALWAGRAGDDI